MRFGDAAQAHKGRKEADRRAARNHHRIESEKALLFPPGAGSLDVTQPDLFACPKIGRSDQRPTFEVRRQDEFPVHESIYSESQRAEHLYLRMISTRNIVKRPRAIEPKRGGSRDAVEERCTNW